MNEAYQIKKTDQMCEDIYENISKMMWEKIEMVGSHEKYDFAIEIETDIYEKIKNKLRPLRHQINANNLSDHDLYISRLYTRRNHNGSYVIQFSIRERTVELQEIKKTIEELTKMVTQMYNSPGMPGMIATLNKIQ